MKRLLLMLIVCSVHTLVSAQTQYSYYSYSFRGFTDFQRLEIQVKNIEGISRCKIHVKEKKHNDFGGEILFEVPWEDRKDDTTPGPDILYELKKLVLESGLEPMEFRQIERK